MKITLNRVSKYYLAAVNAGWKFEEPRLTDDYYIRGYFTCVCGKIGTYALVYPYPSMGESDVDVARILYEVGEFSEAHLIADGHSKEERTHILKALECLL